MARIWEHGSFDHEGVRQLGLDLVFRGMPSDAGGPDYQEAIFSRPNGQLIHGDVEFHVRSSDWYRHRHHLEAAYNRVVLHVAWESDGDETRRQDGQTVPVLSLKSWTTGLGPAPALAPRLFGHPCSAGFRSLDTSTLNARIEEAGLARLESRAEQFSADFTFAHPDQVAYSGLMQAMGFASNREPFRMLAECVPYQWIIGVPAELRGAVLLDAAGLGPRSQMPPPAGLNRDVWRLSRLRPGNHPVRRLMAISVLLERFKPSLVEALARLVLEAKKPREISRALTVSASGSPALGQGRADEMAVSVVLPLVAALLPDRLEPTMLFSAYPSPPSTRWTRTMTEMLRAAGHDLKVRTALQHQGLHATYVSHCRFGKRDGCPVCRGVSREDELQPIFSRPLAG